MPRRLVALFGLTFGGYAGCIVRREGGVDPDGVYQGQVAHRNHMTGRRSSRIEIGNEILDAFKAGLVRVVASRRTVCWPTIRRGLLLGHRTHPGSGHRGVGSNKAATLREPSTEKLLQSPTSTP